MPLLAGRISVATGKNERYKYVRAALVQTLPLRLQKRVAKCLYPDLLALHIIGSGIDIVSFVSVFGTPDIFHDLTFLY